MGAKDSKPSFITYEDAVKRVSESELRRIREAFKRCAGANGTALSLEAFAHEVLSDGVPFEVAEWLYQACGGTKRGIAFRDLLCGIVVLTKGSIEEKIKFLWTLYTNNQQDSTYLYKREFARTLHLENSSLPTENHRSSEILLGLFGCLVQVTFDQFRSWLLIHKDATVLSKWLLSDVNSVQDIETPTFYQSLAGVTHLEEKDIIELEKCFWLLRNNAPTGELDLESVGALLSPPLPPAAVKGAFLAFDENRDGHVDFKELCCGLSAACRGPTTERLKFIYKMFDVDGDLVLSNQEVLDMLSILCEVANEHVRNCSRASTPEGEPAEPWNAGSMLATLAGRMQAKTDSEGEKDSEDQVLTLEEFLIWSVETASSLVTPFLELVFEVCHVALGLAPHCSHHERDIVLGWLRRATGRGYAVGQFWYLVPAEWWAAWAAHCAAPACRHGHHDADDSFTTNSTESMGSLVWRCESVSVGSSSSGVSSASPRQLGGPPGPVDTRPLLEAAPDIPHNVTRLTGEGGALRRDVTLVQHRDFELLPDALWRAVAAWHGATTPLPRQVIRPPNSDVELELYPLQLKLYRHVPSPHRPSTVGGVYSPVPAPPERQLAYTAAFSRLATVKQVLEFVCGALGLPKEEVRLWALSSPPVLLDDEAPTLGSLQIPPRLLLETRSADQTWPEELGALAAGERRHTLIPPRLQGATGLHNLGNTCYMNAALQAVWNTGPLTRYFNSGMHLYEVNTTNPMGTKGALALRYGELCKEVWSCRQRSVAPWRVRGAVQRWARHLAAGQHDAQELLAWLLDLLHEDLARTPTPTLTAPVVPRPAQSVGSHDAAQSAGSGDAGRADAAWAAHLARSHSIITELFCGLLKSRVRCHACAAESTRFEVFNMLSLPLPLDIDIRIHCKVILLDGSIPVRYGVKVPSDGTYLDMKKKLAELCDLPPERMLVVESAGSVPGRVLEDGARVSAHGDLVAYETPTPTPADHHECANGSVCTGTGLGPGSVSPGAGAMGSARSPRASVSGRAANTNSLCMPALFCFQNNSELAMSQSPPGLLKYPPYTDDYRSNTLPKELRKEVRRCSVSSVRSLTPRPSSPMLPPRPAPAAPHPPSYLMAVHRKQVVSDAYFLPWQRCRGGTFGVPLVVGVRAGLSGQQLYACVWGRLARLLSAPPATSNHAADCDDSLRYEFPYVVRVVMRGAPAACGVCAWPRACRGCSLPDTGEPLFYAGDSRENSGHEWYSAEELIDTNSPLAKTKLHRQESERLARNIQGHSNGTLRRIDLNLLCDKRGGAGVMLAIDWEPTALHLRYQSTREKAVISHKSVAALAKEAAAGIDLMSCLRAFTAPEPLEQRYACETCRAAQPATKTLQLWRAPPILIIHLKRFQYMNNKWIKSQKVVNFPYEDFDPTEFLASLPQETILRHKEIITGADRRASTLVDEAITESSSEEESEEGRGEGKGEAGGRARRRRRSIEEKRRQRLESTSLQATPVADDNLVDYHEHRLLPHQDPLDLKYRLYAVISHSGQLSGGHYVAYARNPSGVWLCYNDSSCREVGSRPSLDPAAAYLLFYERQGLAYDEYLPRVSGRPPVDVDHLDNEDTDFKKMCTIA